MKKLLGIWKRYSFLLLIAFTVLGLFDMRIALAAVICMIAPVLTALFKGRYWCGNLCPRGNFYDNVVSKFSKNRKVPKFLRTGLFRTFMVLFLISMFSYGIYKNWGNPFGIGMVFYRIIIITTIIGVALSLFYNHRTWCNFCPMGTLASWVSGVRSGKTKTLQVSNTCISCKICEKKCPLGLVPYEYKGDMLKHPDCIQCGKCVTVCPKKAIGY